MRAMRRLMFHSLSTIALTVTMFTVTLSPVEAQTAAAQVQTRPMIRRPIPIGAVNRSLDLARTELFFGTAKPDGVVTDSEFFKFVDDVITPRFPDGLTVLKGEGQFRGDNGEIVKEDSFVLILLYSLEGFRESSRRINAIRELYKAQFRQESVLRVDDPFAVRASF
jgi:hypothetical protein